MKFILLMLLITGCARECRVYCGPVNCLVSYADKAEFGLIQDQLDDLSPLQANNFCLEYKGLPKIR